MGCCKKDKKAKEKEMEEILKNEGVKKKYIKYLPLLKIITFLGYFYDFGMIFAQTVHVYNITYDFTFKVPSYHSFIRFQIMEGLYILDIFMRQMVDLWRYKTGNMLLIFPLQYTSLLITLDFLSIFPGERILILVGPTEKVKTYTFWLGICQLNRIFRLYRLPAFIAQLSREIEFEERFLFLVRFFYKTFLTIHVLALFVYVVNFQYPLDWMLCKGWDEIDKNPNWLIHRKTKTMFKQRLIPEGDHLYLFSLHYIVSCLTTVGFGDVYPTTMFEQAFVMIIMIYGSIVIRGELASHLTSFQMELDEVRVDLFFRLNAMLEFLKSQNSHAFFNERVKDYYQALWNSREGVSEIAFDETELPTAIAEEVAYDLCKDMFAKCQILCDLPEEFLKSVARAMQFILIPNGIILNTAGQHPAAMYYLVSGELVVRSRYDESIEACILSPGCLIGEIILLCDFQSYCRIETKGECSLLRLKNDDLLPLMDEFPYISEVIHERMSTKFEELSKLYTIKGKEFIRWVEKSIEHKHGEVKPTFPVHVKFRKSNIFGTEIHDDEDLMLETQTYICYQNSAGKHEDPKLWRFMEDVKIPYILSCKSKFVKTVNGLFFMYIFFHVIVGPYCYGYFPVQDQGDYPVCTIFVHYYWAFLFINFIEFWFEVFMFSSFTSWFDKLRYGLLGSCNTVTFWFDLFSFLPLELIVQDRSPLLIRALSKVHKLFRIIRAVENSFAGRRHLVLIRLMKATVVLIYATHFVSCILFSLACPFGYSSNWDSCGNETWIDSYKLEELTPTLGGSFLRLFYPYILSFSFSIAMMTGLGYGDFNPKTEIEFRYCVIFMLLGMLLTVLCTASLSSGFAAGIRPTLVFQQRLLTIRQFMDHHHLHESLQSRVEEHYKLQHQLIGGVSLPHGISNIFYDAPDFISQDKDWLETDIFLQGVPIFTKADPVTLSQVGKALTRYLLPPEIIFLHKGEVRRQMYIIAKGSVVMLKPDSPTGEAHSVFEATAHFGLRDLLFGEPAPMSVKTLSHVLLFVLDSPVFEEACFDDKELMTVINDEISNIKLKKLRLKKATGVEEEKIVAAQERSAEDVLVITSWILFNEEGKSGLRHSTFETFEEAYDGTRFPRLYRWFLVKRIVHPSGQFAKFWTIFMSIISMGSFILLFWELFFAIRAPWFRALQISVDGCHWIDLYLKMHWGYYTANNLLICHPVKTAIHYVWEGTFLFDMLMVMPIEWITWYFGASNWLGYGYGYVWYSKLRWNRAGQIYKFFKLIPISRGVFKNRITSLITLYLFTTISIAWILAAIAMYLSCPEFARRWEEGDEYKLPACLKNSWADINQDVALITFPARIWTSSYYVLQVMLAIGYGDLITLSPQELIFMLILAIIGFLMVQLTLADLTAAQVDSDEIRGVFLESRNAVVRILRLANASPKFIDSVNRYFKHTWRKSKGLQPRTLFEDLHPALEADLFRDFVGDQLSKVTLFEKFAETEKRTLCQYMRKEYFITGERMSRAGNLEFQMFIIVDGEVYVANKKLEWECTLRKNEFFGEIAMLYGLPRSHNVFAACDCEVFVLDADDFATMLQRYPSVREKMIETLGNTTEEYFAKKVTRKKRIGSSVFFQQAEIHNDKIREFVRSREVFSTPVQGADDEIFEVEVKKPAFERFYRSIAGRGTLDDNLPFFYLATDDPKKSNFLIHPNCKFMVGLGHIFLAVFLLSPLLNMYKVIFLTNFDTIAAKKLYPNSIEIEIEIQLSKWIVITADYILEGIMILRILLSFITPFIRDDKTYCKSFRLIAQRYLTSPRFLLDWVTTTPWHLVMFSSKFVSINYRFCLVRILRIFLFLKKVTARSDDLDVSLFRYKLMLSCIGFVLMSQFSAGFFFFISCPYPGIDTCIDGGWVEKLRGQAKSLFGNNQTNLAIWNLPSRHYVRSLYWVIQTVTTSGFGDITANSLDEMCFSVFLFLMGTFSLAVMLGNITTGLASERKGELDFLGSIRSSVRFLKSAGLSDHIESLLLSYFDRMWYLSRGVPYATALRVLPLTMQIDASTAIYSNVLRKCKFFGKVADFTFIRAIALHVNHSFYLPGDRIVSEGEFGSMLHIVFKGEVAAYIKHPETGELLYKKSYRPEEAFGKVPALFLDAPYNKTYRSEGYTEVLVIHQHDIKNISSYFKQWNDHLEALVQNRYGLLAETMDSIFSVAQSQRKEELVLTYADLLKDEEEYDPMANVDKEEDNYDEDDAEGELEEKIANIRKPPPVVRTHRKPPKNSVIEVKKRK